MKNLVWASVFESLSVSAWVVTIRDKDRPASADPGGLTVDKMFNAATAQPDVAERASAVCLESSGGGPPVPNRREVSEDKLGWYKFPEPL